MCTLTAPCKPSLCACWLGSLWGEVLLIENVAPDEGAVAVSWAQGLVKLGFPGKQFRHQENAKKKEILNSLQYIPPPPK